MNWVALIKAVLATLACCLGYVLLIYSDAVAYGFFFFLVAVLVVLILYAFYEMFNT